MAQTKTKRGKPVLAPAGAIKISGARQNNLKNLSLEVPLNELIVVTGVSGSGKSSLVFDTLYAEGQRRYVETFSPYARQFLDRMDRPQVDKIEGVPPAIAIDQTNPVRTSRSTVGTMSELADHFKLLFARCSHLHCRNCGAPVAGDSAQSIAAQLHSRAVGQNDPRLIICFALMVPENFSEQEVESYLNRQGYSRVYQREDNLLYVIQDRFRISNTEAARVNEALEAALRYGQGQLEVFAESEQKDGQKEIQRWSFSSDFRCAPCNILYSAPTPSSFSFNSPIGACETCRGFGRIIGIDAGLIVPDESKTLAEGAVKPWQTDSYRECQQEMMMMAEKRGIPTDTPFAKLTVDQRSWVIDGEAEWKTWPKSWPKYWYGVRRFFDWLETKAYKMHVRVLLSRYRSYNECHSCKGARLKPDSLLWRVFSDEPVHGRQSWSVADLMQLPISRLRSVCQYLQYPANLDAAGRLVLGEINSRIDFLERVGLAYLTLDRQSRTLSGGEVQRINLTTALGTSLVNTLFVLDEPSIGLHPRDIDRILQVMQRLRDAGNSLVVVEHDPQIIFAADRLLDIGPGPGERGGNIIAFDTPVKVAANPDSVTGDYLAGRRRVESSRKIRPVALTTPQLILRGAEEHNLKKIDIAIPLGHLVTVAGVSGSGKSTLVQDVLYPALRKYFGEPVETPGRFGALLGAQHLAAAVFVDQSAIGKSARSNPASYVGAWDRIRALFALSDLARERKYTAGTFSFNAGNGRCQTCNGSGFEHIEMQFLSDVYLRCGECDGKRYRPEVLEVKVRGKNLADVLNMTVREAIEFFTGDSKLATALQPLVDVGLDYLRLGQPVPTLSGGEAQRLKLAAHLSDSAAKTSKTGSKGSKLFIFDEPTTGLHFADIGVLIDAFEKLIEAGHTVLLVEHNLDVIQASDYLIELGPEGGDGGGELVFAGSISELVGKGKTATADALRQYQVQLKKSQRPKLLAAEATPAYIVARSNDIEVRHAREHNLKNINVNLPRNKMSVITGLSGSGKSTLAFDIIFGEGQRRYLESLNAYARQFVQPGSRPDVDAVFGIPPTVAIEQRVSRGGRKSTVGTLTEIQPFLRLLYVKLGTQYCPDCQLLVSPQTLDEIAQQLLVDYQGQTIELLAPLVINRKGLYTDLAKWARNKGYEQLRVDGEYLPTRKWPRLDRYKEHNLDLPVGMVSIKKSPTKTLLAALREQLAVALDIGKGLVRVVTTEEPDNERSFSILRSCSGCGTSFPEPDPRLFSYNAKHGWCVGCYGTAVETRGKVEDPHALDILEEEESEQQVCQVCHGARLNPQALAVRFRDRNIAELSALPVNELKSFFAKLRLASRETEIARDLVSEIDSRLQYLGEVGLGYLQLDRGAPTLSGGEAQRIRLAAQLGSNLTGVCYILDEPTIGLHPRDNQLLLGTLDRLLARGNTLLVVEHDEETIRRADHVVDLGPAAGVHGGEVVAQGTFAQILANPASVTGRYLREPLQHPLRPRRAVSKNHPCIALEGANLHNIKGLNVGIPLGRLTVVTGVSGSGKSTFARDIFLANMKRVLAGENIKNITLINGWKTIERVLEVDQTPIGKTPRSCPATYIGFWDNIRKLFADTTEAKVRGYSASRFSFNAGPGRCPGCDGAGMVTVEMNFLPNVKVLCEVCHGDRFNRETLAVRWRNKNIAEVLAMPISFAAEFFMAHTAIHRPLQLLEEVGLGYLTLGQASPTLSGGEAQRIKLVTELAKIGQLGGRRRAEGEAPQTLYVLDEPTVGLHMADIGKLIIVLQKLVDTGHSVLCIEHDLDLMAEADWIIDFGPEGGDAGGKVVVSGAPEKIMTSSKSHTSRVLHEFFNNRAAAAKGKIKVSKARQK